MHYWLKAHLKSDDSGLKGTEGEMNKVNGVLHAAMRARDLDHGSWRCNLEHRPICKGKAETPRMDWPEPGEKFGGLMYGFD